MHRCPECSHACYCRGDIDDDERVDEPSGGCVHECQGSGNPAEFDAEEEVAFHEAHERRMGR